MKKVFSSHASLSHAWANQTHPIGKSSAMFFDGPVICISKDGQFIETTKGAKVEYLKGLELFNRLLNKENVNGHKINGFTLLENSSEALTIGCHVINWPVINQFFNN